MDTHYIYTLSCPTTDEVKYVGCSLRPQIRLNGHLGKQAMPKVKEWIRSIGYAPVLHIIDSTAADYKKELESFWIHQFQTWGFQLLNTQYVLGSIRKKREPLKRRCKTGLIYRRHKNLMCREDASRISKAYRLSESIVRLALYKGVFTDGTLKKITDYYEKKWKRLGIGSRNFYFIPDQD